MGSHITTNTKSIKTFQLNLKSKVITSILNCNMKTFTMSSLVFLIVAIAFIANATGRQFRSETSKCLDTATKCWEEIRTSGISGNGTAEMVACCKETFQEKFQKKIPEECIKYMCEAAKQLQK